MKIVKEHKVGNDSYFSVTEVIQKEVIEKFNVNIRGVVIKTKGCKKYLIYNSNLEVISDTYLFLNKNNKKVADNTKRNYYYALKLLYSFKEIINKDINKFKNKDFRQLESFLNGVSAKGSDYTYELMTKRSNKTINIFFSAYREYYKFLGLISSDIFSFESNNSQRLKFGNGKVMKKEYVPKYISEDKFCEIMNLLNNDEDLNVLKSKCIIRLMYQAGLRIGEVLGLTFEDLQLRTSSIGEKNLVVIIRNRLTDNEYQQSKMCMKITDSRNYLSNDYRTRNIGYQEAILFDFDGINTYDLLSEYIDIAHSQAERKRTKKYKSTIADSVDQFKRENKENHYIFLNSQYGVLSDDTWNTELKIIFEKVDLYIDKKKREHGLNHRFRHGFCMKLQYGYGNIKRSAIKIFTRHSSDKGLECYNNPTLSELIEMKNEISERNGILDLFKEVKKNDK